MSIKEGDMVSIRQDFINRYKNVQESIIKAIDGHRCLYIKGRR